MLSSAMLKPPCATCENKSAGIFRCEGCLQVFCRKHLMKHREFLSEKLEMIVQEHDILQQVIFENENSNVNDLPILKQIDQWEKLSIEKIKLTADEARAKITILTSLTAVSKQLNDLAVRLENARREDDYIEADIRIWSSTIQKLKDDINIIPISMSLDEDPKDILIAKVNVFSTLRESRQTEQFGESYGPILIENNGLIAKHIGLKNDTAFVRGIGEYSSGKHKIRFFLQKNSIKYITGFDVIPSVMPITGVFNTAYDVYGWSSNDDIFSHSDELVVADNFKDMKGQTSFEIELELDCDSQKISYINQKTQNQRKLDIDIQRCPFPWQVRFYLFEIGDYIRLIH